MKFMKHHKCQQFHLPFGSINPTTHPTRFFHHFFYPPNTHTHNSALHILMLPWYLLNLKRLRFFFFLYIFGFLLPLILREHFNSNFMRISQKKNCLNGREGGMRSNMYRSIFSFFFLLHRHFHFIEKKLYKDFLPLLQTIFFSPHREQFFAFSKDIRIFFY